jgi:polysulfide reductase chain C
MAEHFVQPPHWEWYILAYFFLGGLSGGAYALATMLRLIGGPRDEATARIGFLTAFPLLVACPILLALDLGQPLRFWHMLIDTTPGHLGPAFKDWSPMSVGSWVLLLYGVFAFVSFLEVLVPAGRSLPRILSGGIGRIFTVVGAILGLFIASYTGVLLSVSNQPIWSDTWALGGLFLASSLGGAAALLSWLARHRPEAEATERRLFSADRYFALLELVLIVLFFVNLAGAGTLARALAGPWAGFWGLVVVSLLLPLAGLGRPRPRTEVAAGSSSVPAGRAASGSRTMVLAGVLIGVLLMRFVVIFSAQY